jgi:hypothetical protein
MMTVERQTLLRKVGQFLAQEISQDAIYAWALQIAVSREYEDLAKQDPLIKETIEALLMMQHTDLKAVPTRKAIEYYRRCLSGEEKFVPLRERKDLDKLRIPNEFREAMGRKKMGKTGKEKVFALMRFYVALFGLSVLGIYAFSLIRDGLLGPAAGAVKMSALWEPMLYIIYALTIVMPVRFMAKGFLFYFTFPILLLGMIYFWSIPVRLFQNILFIILALPLSAIPATLAVILFARAKEQERRTL